MLPYLRLMPLLLLASASCPEPARVSCNGPPCLPRYHSQCCPNACASFTLLLNNGSGMSRPERESGSSSAVSLLDVRDGEYCDNAPGVVVRDGCSVCLCKYKRRECVFRDCRACSVNGTSKYRHGEGFSRGCLQCGCDDGELQCDHSQCQSCDHRGNSTRSGEDRGFDCGGCSCHDGEWTCDESCQTSDPLTDHTRSASTRLRVSLLLVSLVGLLPAVA